MFQPILAFKVALFSILLAAQLHQFGLVEKAEKSG
jgi:hypothetical protein